MYFAGLSTNFCHSMVAISAFVEKLWSTYTRFVFSDWIWVASLTKCFLLVKTWSENGPKEAANSFKLLLDVFVLQKIEVCYLLLNCWCLLNELDVTVINRRLFVENVLSLLLFFRFCGGIKRISALTYDYLAV